MEPAILQFPTKEVQNAFWKGEVKRKARKVKCPISQGLISPTTPCENGQEPPRLIPDYSASPIVHALYVRPDLASLLLTGHALSLPDTIQEPVLPTEAAPRPPRAYTRLTLGMFQGISGQLDTQPMDKFSAEKRREIEQRYRTIWEWADAEGWTDSEPL